MTNMASLPGDVVNYPLVVDLDWTLISSDSLYESFAASVFRAPLKTLAALGQLRFGRARFKQALAEIGVLDASMLPLREEFVAFLTRERARGRELHLVTAADQSIADAVSRRTGLFTSAIGSSNGRNLKGAAKSRYLQQRFPDGFSYAGDSASDVEVWKAARSGVLVGVAPSTRRAVDKINLPVEESFGQVRAGIGVWLRAIRVHQWSKNLLLFVPLILAHRYTDPVAVATAVGGFFCLCLMASGTYLINDLKDLEADRAHETKRFRPLAAGRISISSAGIVAGLLIATSILGATFLSYGFLGLLLLYLLTTGLYTATLKHLPMVDIFTLGFLYGLRVYMGMVLVDAPFSNWLLAFSLLFFVSLSACKRHVEVVRAGKNKNGASKEVADRGYRPEDAVMTLSFGVSSGVVATLILFLYLVNDAEPGGVYRNPDWLWLIGYCVFMWLARIWFLSHRGELDSDPVAFAIKDKVSLGLGLIVAAVFVRAVL